VLEKLGNPGPAVAKLDHEELRIIRAVRVLEHVGTPAAKKALEKLSNQKLGADEADRAVRAALGRLNKRP
jgi:hypothetical protein